MPIEHYWFGRDWPESRDRFVDSLGIIQRALATGEISSEGSRFYDFPTMPLATKPFQERIPFWYPGSPFTAGRHGMSLMWPGKISEDAYELYLETWHSHKDDDIRIDGPGRRAARRIQHAAGDRADRERGARHRPARAWRAWFAGRATATGSTT